MGERALLLNPPLMNARVVAIWGQLVATRLLPSYLTVHFSCGLR